MVTGCVIRKCSSVWSPISYTSYHCFPLKNNEMMTKWMKAIPPGYINIPKQSSRICSRHFFDNCFIYCQSGKRTLKKDAVPTLFGSEAKEDILVIPTKVKKTEDTNDNDVCFKNEDSNLYRYVKKSKYLQKEKPVLKRNVPISCRATINHNEKPRIIIHKALKPKISKKEIDLKKQIIMLKIRQLRSKIRIQYRTKVLNSFETIDVKTENFNG